MPPSRDELSSCLGSLLAALATSAGPAGALEPLRSDQTQALIDYAALVAAWNQRVDLTGAKRASELAEVLWADALVMRDPQLVPDGVRVLDVGAGVGAPTLPLLVLRPDLRGACVEPRRKRVAFLRSAIGQLGLAERVVVHEGRIELDGKGELPTVAQGAGMAFSRATFAPAQWLELGLTLAPRVAVFGARDGLPPPPAASDAELICERHYTLPWSSAPRVLGVYVRAQ